MGPLCGLRAFLAAAADTPSPPCPSGAARRQSPWLWAVRWVRHCFSQTSARCLPGTAPLAEAPPRCALRGMRQGAEFLTARGETGAVPQGITSCRQAGSHCGLSLITLPWRRGSPALLWRKVSHRPPRHAGVQADASGHLVCLDARCPLSPCIPGGALLASQAGPFPEKSNWRHPLARWTPGRYLVLPASPLCLLQFVVAPLVPPCGSSGSLAQLTPCCGGLPSFRFPVPCFPVPCCSSLLDAMTSPEFG